MRVTTALASDPFTPKPTPMPFLQSRHSLAQCRDDDPIMSYVGRVSRGDSLAQACEPAWMLGWHGGCIIEWTWQAQHGHMLIDNQI